MSSITRNGRTLCTKFLTRKFAGKAVFKPVFVISSLPVYNVSWERTVSLVSGVLLARKLWPWPSDLPQATEWGYHLTDGPLTWPLKYTDAGGFQQSPIDIQTSIVRSAPDLKESPLSWSYGSQICKSILNTGCGWRVDISAADESGLSGGPLEHNYELVQFHCHWGNSRHCGSEHTVDGKAYVGELHFVHWNKDIYANCADAVRAPKGLTVIAVFLELGQANKEMETLCEALQNIPYRDQRSDLPAAFDPTYFYPADHSYWTYEGSLTTPPCYESVTWIVFKSPMSVSEKQLHCFRSMRSQSENEETAEGKFKGRIHLNFRPPQNLNARIIRECSYS